MPDLSVPVLSAAVGLPVWLAALAVLMFLAVVALVAGVAGVVLRRADRVDLPQVLLGLSHVVSSLCGLLPWGRSYAAPALVPPAPASDAPLAPTVVLVRAEPALHAPGDGQRPA